MFVPLTCCVFFHYLTILCIQKYKRLSTGSLNFLFTFPETFLSNFAQTLLVMEAYLDSSQLFRRPHKANPLNCFELSVYLHQRVMKTETTTLLYPGTFYTQGLFFYKHSVSACGKGGKVFT